MAQQNSITISASSLNTRKANPIFAQSECEEKSLNSALSASNHALNRTDPINGGLR